MRGLWAGLAGLPPLLRAGILGIAGILVAGLIGLGAVAWVQQRDAAATRAYATAREAYREAMGGDRGEARLALAATALRQFLQDYPRSRAAGRAWYELGNVEYARHAHDAALEAFREAIGRDTGAVGALSRLATGYVWEAKKEPARALEAFREGLAGRTPEEFLYGEFLLGMARAQEQLGQPAAAIEAYRRFLKDVPQSSRATDVRLRLAYLGASAESP